jgi:dihydroxyacetone kinase-like predicted kinase
MGAHAVVRGGQTMNPSAGEIRAAIESTGAPQVIVLPDNKNIVLAAEQAAAGLPADVRVLPARSIPQGVAALVAMNPEATLDDNVAAMRQAIEAVHTGEVTLAARATRIHGLEIREGQPIGLIDGDLRIAEATVPEAVKRCVELLVEGRDAPLVTLYAGEGEDEASAAAVAEALRQDLGVEVELVHGGQPHYPYLMGVE